jgi:transposase
MSYTVVQKIRDKHYLYEVDGYWDKEKKQARQKRRYIGRCDEDGNLIEKKLSQREVSVSKTFGPSYLLLDIAGQTGLYDKVVSAFGERADTIVSLAIMRIIRPEALRNIADQLEESFLPELLGMEEELTSQFLSRFLSDLGKDERSRHVLFGSMIDNDDVLVYDLTSFKSSSRGNDYLEYGTEYRSTGLPQANFGLVHSLDSDLPVYYKLFPGSINDIVTLRNLVVELKEMGVSGAHLLLDRGFFSESNLDMMISEGLGFTIPVPFSRKIAKELISESNRGIDNPETTRVFKGSVIRVFDSKASVGENTIRAITYLDETRRKDEITTLYSRLDGLEDTLNGKKWHPHIVETISRHDKPLLKMLAIVNDDGVVRTVRRRNSIAAAENKCGKMILLTTSDDAWDVVLQRYRQRNDAEMDFRTLKAALEGGVRYLSSAESVKGMLCVEFIALVLRTSLLNRARDAGLLTRMWVTDMINELAKLKITRIGETWRLNEVSKKQRELLQALGVDHPVDAY